MSVILETCDVKEKCFRSPTWRTAIRSIWKKEKFQALERRVAGFCQELKLRFSVDLGSDLSIQQLSETRGSCCPRLELLLISWMCNRTSKSGNLMRLRSRKPITSRGRCATQRTCSRKLPGSEREGSDTACGYRKYVDSAG